MSVTVLILLASFGVKHFIADFWLQTSNMVAEKGIYGKMGGIHHALLHGLLTYLVIYFVIKNSDLAAAAFVIDFLLHYHIDWFKQQVNKNLTYTDKLWWFYMGADQALHYLTYIGIIFYVTTSQICY